MGKYSSSARQAVGPKPERPHSIWRGIGCLLMIIIPAMSLAASALTINYGTKHHWPIPPEMLGYIKLPDLFYKSSGLMIILSPILKINNLYALVVIGLFYMMVLSGVISVVYALMYRSVGPSQYGPHDAPPIKGKVKRFKR